MNDSETVPAIEVRFYSGYREGETPRALVAGGREYPVETVLSRERRQDVETGRSFEIFRVRVAGSTVVIRKDESGESEVLPSSDLSFISFGSG